MTGVDEVACNPHPCAPHGFNRNASHSEDRYVCDCEGWWPDRSCAGLEMLQRAETAEAALLAKSAAYDALVADAEMFRWLVAEWDANGTIHATRYHPPGTAGCGLFTVSSQHVRGYGLRGAIKAAQDKAATPPRTTERRAQES